MLAETNDNSDKAVGCIACVCRRSHGASRYAKKIQLIVYAAPRALIHLVLIVCLMVWTNVLWLYELVI
jgi:hypothetical protein